MPKWWFKHFPHSTAESICALQHYHLLSEWRGEKRDLQGKCRHSANKFPPKSFVKERLRKMIFWNFNAIPSVYQWLSVGFCVSRSEGKDQPDVETPSRKTCENSQWRDPIIGFLIEFFLLEKKREDELLWTNFRDAVALALFVELINTLLMIIDRFSHSETMYRHEWHWIFDLPLRN